LVAYNGVDILAAALRFLAPRDDWRLRVAGTGPVLDDAFAKRFVGAQIESVTRSWLSEAELDALISACDIVLAPYRSATQSGLLAQALAHGKSCVVTPVGALGEQIGDGVGGWVAARADAAAFAAAMEQALTSVSDAQVKAQGALALARAAWQHDYWRWLEDV
jgi:glycosyltransferase involved in cell wall biosynthesis